MFIAQRNGDKRYLKELAIRSTTKEYYPYAQHFGLWFWGTIVSYMIIILIKYIIAKQKK